MGRDLVGTVAEAGPGLPTSDPAAGCGPTRPATAAAPGATAEPHGVLLGRARLRPGEPVALLGANGAVGMCLARVVARSGAEVVAVVRSGGGVLGFADAGRAHAVPEAGGLPRMPDSTVGRLVLRPEG